MSQKNEGFEMFRKYFINLEDKDILLKNDNDIPYINISWIFTESLDRTIIQKTLANIMKNNNPKYEEKSRHKNRRPEDISDIEVFTYPDGNMYLQFIGADGWSKLKITDKIPENYRTRIPTITLDTFEKEIQKTLKSSVIHGLRYNAGLSTTQFEQIINFFNSKHLGVQNLSQVEQTGIHLALDNAFKNLTNYYQYLIKQKKEHETHTCTIQQREDSQTTPRQHRGETAPDRRFPVIPFNLRSSFLQNLNPTAIIEVSEYTKTGEIIPNAYTTYVFKQALSQIKQQQDGYLFVSEPLDGTRETRLFFLSQQKFDDFTVEKGQDKYAEIVRHHLEMSQKEFTGDGTAKLSHTDPQTYSDRINFFVQGVKAASLASNLKSYQSRLQTLYSNDSLLLPYYTPRPTYTKSQIANIGINDKGTIDRTAQTTLEQQKDSNTQSHN